MQLSPALHQPCSAPRSVTPVPQSAARKHPMLHSGKSMEFWPSWISSCYPPVQFLAGAQAQCSVNSVLGCLQGRSPLGRAWQKAQGGFCCFCPFLCSSPTCLPRLCIQRSSCCSLLLPALSHSLGFLSLPAGRWEQPFQTASLSSSLSTTFLKSTEEGMGKCGFMSLYRNTSPN